MFCKTSGSLGPARPPPCHASVLHPVQFTEGQVYQLGFANMSEVAGGKEGEHRFAGRTLSGDKPVLLSFIGIEGSSEIQYKLHVENVVLGSSLQSALVKAFE